MTNRKAHLSLVKIHTQDQEGLSEPTPSTLFFTEHQIYGKQGAHFIRGNCNPYLYVRKLKLRETEALGHCYTASEPESLLKCPRSAESTKV